MKVKQVLNCSFEKWYPKFEHITIKSEIIPIPDEVVAYLKSDSTIILPQSCQRELDDTLKRNKDDFSDADEEEDWSSDENQNEYPNFEQFDEKILEALRRLGNKVFIKLNWSSPKDAIWSLNKLSCDRLSDVYILLRSSDFISHDLNEPFDKCDDQGESQSQAQIKYYLVLREWIAINPSMEFRCFVLKNKLIGVSQRDCRTYYKILLDLKEELLERVEDFYLKNIYTKYFEDSFVFDVCLGKKRIKLLDFNPFDSVTDSLLFSWDELCDESLHQVDEMNPHKSKSLELRLVEHDSGINSNQYGMYSQPTDFLTPEALSDLMQQGMGNQMDKSSDEEQSTSSLENKT